MAVKKKATPKRQEIYAPPDVQIPRRFGGGVLKERVVRELPSKKVIQYALAYINPLIFSGDNGRVLGYDNAHGFSHKHFMGEMTRESFPGPLLNSEWVRSAGFPALGRCQGRA